jgi:molybdopterin-guanine dinucleotide biosynthesis protein A
MSIDSPAVITGHITAVVLAGGRGRRMEGADKGLVSLRGRPLAAHVMERLRPQVGGFIIVANRNADRYKELGAVVIADRVAAGEGPLAGLAAGLDHAETEWVLAVSCDTPLLPADLVARLRQCAEANAAGICTAHDGERLHATVILTRRSNLAPLIRFLDAGGRKVRDFLTTAGAGSADFSDEAAAFANVNDPDALARLEAAGL